jgi:hypothetical protein
MSGEFKETKRTVSSSSSSTPEPMDTDAIINNNNTQSTQSAQSMPPDRIRGLDEDCDLLDTDSKHTDKKQKTTGGEVKIKDLGSSSSSSTNKDCYEDLKNYNKTIEQRRFFKSKVDNSPIILKSRADPKTGQITSVPVKNRRFLEFSDLLNSTLSMDPEAKEVTCSQVPGDILQMLVEWMEFHGLNPHRPPIIPGAPILDKYLINAYDESRSQRIDQWDCDFLWKYGRDSVPAAPPAPEDETWTEEERKNFPTTRLRIFDILQGSDYLGIPELNMQICAFVACSMKGRDEKEVERILAGKADFKELRSIYPPTPEEEAKMMMAAAASSSSSSSSASNNRTESKDVKDSTIMSAQTETKKEEEDEEEDKQEEEDDDKPAADKEEEDEDEATGGQQTSEPMDDS